MIFRLVCFVFVLFGSVACQHYTIKSSAMGSVDEFKVAQYRISSVAEAESDPFLLEGEQKVVFKDVSAERKAEFEKAFLNEKEKVLGKSNGNGEEIFVNAKINRRVLCKFGMSASAGSGSRGLTAGYTQMGNIVFNLVGLSKTNQEVFNIDIEYEMNSGSTSIIKFWACDSYNKITNIINEKILPLAIKEIGQNRVIDK